MSDDYAILAESGMPRQAIDDLAIEELHTWIGTTAFNALIAAVERDRRSGRTVSFESVRVLLGVVANISDVPSRYPLEAFCRRYLPDAIETKRPSKEQRHARLSS